jgi:hypothetical protein
MKKKSKLDAMQMPQKKEGLAFELELGPDENESPEGDMSSEMAGEAEGESGDEPRMEEESAGSEALAEVSDDDLMAELRKRGLMAKASKASSKPSPDDEY